MPDDQSISWNDLMSYVDRIAPGHQYGESSHFDDMPVFHRLAITRWFADVFENPSDLDVIRQHKTLGDAWRWVEGNVKSGERLRSARANPVGTTSRVRLRPILPERDVVPLYEAAFDPTMGGAWRFRGRTMPIEQFARTLFDGTMAQFMVELTENRASIGLVTAYEENPYGLHCKVGFLRCGRRASGDSSAVLEGMIAFLTYIFSNFPYRKVFAEVPDYNLGLYVEGFAKEEGVLRDFFFHDGRFVDLHIVSITREAMRNIARTTGW